MFFKGRFARMAISVDLCWPLISKLRVEGKIRRVEHKNLPKVYYECGCFGHMKDMCPKVRKKKELEDMGEEDSGHMATSAAKHPSMVELDRKVKTKSYEDWMVVSQDESAKQLDRSVEGDVESVDGGENSNGFGLIDVDTTVNVMMAPIDMVVDDKITYNGIVGVEIVEGIEPE
ncbi:hypothetical protein Golob_027689, partial [Gossypium lobatum]|nr:hypothetical protein [Gossypium lobatum]